MKTMTRNGAVEIKKSYPVESPIEGLEFILFKDDQKDWHVIEKTTGLAFVSCHRTKKEAIQDFKTKGDSLNSNQKKYTKKIIKESTKIN